MPEVKSDSVPIYVFELEDTYMFKHYFERNDIFAELQEYYNNDDYRFEIPLDEFPEIQEFLEQNHYQPILVDDIAEFSVVKEQYTPHADILKNSVIHWSRREHNFFIMKDPQATEFAIEQGATRIEDTDKVLGL